MTNLLTRTEADRARETIEGAIREHTFCRTCGEPMGISERGTGLWIECGSLRERRGIRLAFAEAWHERHPVQLPVDELILAA